MGIRRAQYLAGPSIDHVQPPARYAGHPLIGFAVVFGPIVRTPSLQPSARVRTEKRGYPHVEPYPGSTTYRLLAIADEVIE
jgi:hypothetical protein